MIPLFLTKEIIIAGEVIHLDIGTVYRGFFIPSFLDFRGVSIVANPVIIATHNHPFTEE